MNHATDEGSGWQLTRSNFFWAYLLVVGCVVGGYLWAVRPMMGPNTRSRWDTVWSLVEFGTYQIFDTPEHAKRYDKPLQMKTIDKVMLPGKDGEEGEFRSSKPPLLPTTIAGFVWLLKQVFREPVTKDSLEIYSKAVLYVFQLLPFLVMLRVYRSYLDRYAANDFAWFVSLVAAGFGTLVTGFLVTLNNHVIAACFGFFTAYLLVTIWHEGKREPWRFALAGLLAGWTAANELPAGLLVLVTLGVGAWCDLRKTLLYLLPPLLLVTAAFFATNYLATGGMKPAYLRKELYDYPGSYWSQAEATVEGEAPPKKSGIDGLNEEPENLGIYFLNMTVGHHGVFSLSPIFLLAFYGAWLVGRGKEPRLVGLHWPILFISAGVFCFFWLVTDQRNYGGGGHGMRWLMWLAPLWLLLLPLGLNGLATCRRWRTFVWACLGISIFSVFGVWEGPWSKSWFHKIFLYYGWIDY